MTEAAERAIFTCPALFGKLDGKAAHASGRYHESILGLEAFPREIFELLNAARDSGLKPNLTTPDYCLSWGYPTGGKFSPHFDSRYRWGEDVLGISLGASCEMHFLPASKSLPAGSTRQVLVVPRRSIYIMEHEARTHWKHGESIEKNSEPRPRQRTLTVNFDTRRQPRSARPNHNPRRHLQDRQGARGQGGRSAVLERRELPPLAHAALHQDLPGRIAHAIACRAPRELRGRGARAEAPHRRAARALAGAQRGGQGAEPAAAQGGGRARGGDLRGVPRAAAGAHRGSPAAVRMRIR
jgi:hypothetical protein